jgi:tight adherence protein B
MSPALALGFAAGSFGAWALVELALAGVPAMRLRVPRALRGAEGLVEAVVRAGREGRDPGALERRRLLAAGAVIAFCAGAALMGPVAGLACAAAGPWSVARILRARRERYRRAVDAGSSAIAVALADALAAGHSLRGAVAEAVRGLDGQAGYELRRTAAELAAGAPTDVALTALAARTRAPRLEAIVAACLVQSGLGGDLARLLRECAEAFEDQARLDGEVRAATAQARFTGLIVVLLPFGGALLAELASPGFLAGLAGSFMTAWLVGLALAMQVAAAVLIHRLGKVRW